LLNYFLLNLDSVFGQLLFGHRRPLLVVELILAGIIGVLNLKMYTDIELMLRVLPSDLKIIIDKGQEFKSSGTLIRINAKATK
jgi:hypothetical protein